MNFLLPLGMMDEGGFSIVDSILEASIANQILIAILFYLLGYQIYVAMERYVTYRDSEEATGKFLKLFMESLKKGDFEGAKSSYDPQQEPRGPSAEALTRHLSI